MNAPLSTNTDMQSDIWSDWLLHARHGGDAEYGEAVHTAVAGYADRVLDGARLAPGMTLADIGTGSGIVAFRAFERKSGALNAILVDISRPLLRHTEELAREHGIQGRCQFLQRSAEHLDGIIDASADVVTTRAVLAYVPDKLAALREFHRILKPGGRLSIAEPILRDEALIASALRKSVEASAADEDAVFLRLLHRWKSAQYPDTKEKIDENPITNYSERDLLYFVMNAGFTEIHLELHIDVLPAISTSWDTFLNTSPHPQAPTTNTILDTSFSPAERKLFEAHARPMIEQNRSITTNCIAYLQATKP